MKEKNGWLKLLFILLGVHLSLVLPLCSVDAGSIGNWDIQINTDSIEYILLNPEKILENPDLFWKTDEAYKLTDAWHNGNKIPKTTNDYYNKWLVFLKDQAGVPKEDRHNHPAFRFLNELRAITSIYYKQALPHIRGFLPQNSIAFTAGMYITAKTLPYAFMTNGNMVIDVLYSGFNMNADQVFNTLTHETFHIAYGYNRYLRREMPLEDGFLYGLLDDLHNEGMAVYVADKAQFFFPSKSEQDYQLLQDLSEVKKRFQMVNDIFSAAEKKELSQDEIRKKAWEFGVMQRGYYIAGAFMAQSIDEKLGRGALVKTVAEGPAAFVGTYNEIAEKDMKIHPFKTSPDIPVWQALKLAVFDADDKKFNLLAKEMKNPQGILEKRTQTQLNRIGYSQVYQKKWDWAIKVFSLNTVLFPSSANAFDSLAEVYMLSGNKDLAITNYEKSLKLNPQNQNAAEQLKKLQEMK